MSFLRAIAHWLHHTTGSEHERIHIYLGDLVWVYPWGGWDVALFGHYLTWETTGLVWSREGEDGIVLFGSRRQRGLR